MIRSWLMGSCVWLGLLAACTTAPPTTNDNANVNDNLAPDPLRVINTGAEVRGDSLIRVADGQVVGRVGADDDVALQIVAVAGGTTAVTAESTLLLNDFAIAGSTLIARGADDGVYAYDITSGTGTATRVGGQLLQTADAGLITTDGGDIIAFITAEPFICWIDRRDNPLRIRTFAVDPVTDFKHVAVSESRVAFFDGDQLLVQDTATPAVAAQVFDVGADSSVPPAFADGRLTYIADGTLRQLAVDEGGTVTDTSQTAVTAVAWSGSRLATFGDDGEDVTTWPSVVVESTTAFVAPAGDEAERVPPGWGRTLAIAADGAVVFVAGGSDPDTVDTDPLSFWRDGFIEETFLGATDTAGRVAAGQVAAADRLVGFILSTTAGPRIGYLEVE